MCIFSHKRSKIAKLDIIGYFALEYDPLCQDKNKKRDFLLPSDQIGLGATDLAQERLFLVFK